MRDLASLLVLLLALSHPITGALLLDVSPSELEGYPEGCRTPLAGSCSWYHDCLEQVHPCGEEGYAEGYGLVYCRRFKERAEALDEKGRTWVNATMLCLQNALVPFLRSQHAPCDDILDAAFDSHPICYTQPDPSRPDVSICYLFSPWDIWNILTTVKVADLFRPRSIKQIAQVVKICTAYYTHDIVGSSPQSPLLSPLSSLLSPLV
eukprot:TRINITY_DN33082_c0_g1_i1.p2 TRINITY_DN33082_c0_g1~~TRINITY_DN33082_c0_g1_i1.p2  ORF type:complete len:214 (+),score=39.63 TRINITY_DN33082_c0_g1_i1:23-643(+)